MKKLLIHIGAHKTGTTSLQRYLDANRQNLRDQGILYPNSCRYQFAQHRLAFSLRGLQDPVAQDSPDFAHEVEALRSEIIESKLPVTIISSEEFFNLAKEKISALVEAFSDFDITVLAVLRRPDELFASNYNQRVKDPKNDFLRHYSYFLDKPGMLVPDCLFDLVLKNWSEGLPNGQLTVRCYESYSNILAYGAEVIGFDPAPLTVPARRINISVSVRTAELVRLGKHAKLGEAQLRRLIDIGNAIFPHSGSLLSPEERMRLLVRADAMVAQVFSQFVKGDNIYASHRFKVADFPPKTVLNNLDMIKVISALMLEGPRAPADAAKLEDQAASSSVDIAADA